VPPPPRPAGDPLPAGLAVLSWLLCVLALLLIVVVALWILLELHKLGLVTYWPQPQHGKG
jgi:hypothetical protein